MSGLSAIFAGRRAYSAHIAGNRLSEAGKYEEAREKHAAAAKYYAEGMAAGKLTPGQLMAYGVLLLRMREYDKARDAFLKAEHDKAITKKERNQLRVNFAILQWKTGHLDSAIEQLRIAEQEGHTGLIYGSLGYILIEKATQTGDFTEALAYNKEALEYDEEDSVILDNMAQLQLRMGEREEAKKFFLRAHEAKPSQVDTLYYLAKLAVEDGEKDKAKEYLDTALSGNYSSLCTTARDDAQALRDSL